MASKKFTFDFGTLSVKRKYDEEAEAPFLIQYRTKKFGITMRLSGGYLSEQERDARFAAFKKADAEPFLRGMHRVLSGASAKPAKPAKS